jgi:hypothetical protein
VIRDAFARAHRIAQQSFIRHGEEVAALLLRRDQCYTPDQILNDWWPDIPSQETQPETESKP